MNLHSTKTSGQAFELADHGPPMHPRAWPVPGLGPDSRPWAPLVWPMACANIALGTGAICVGEAEANGIAGAGDTELGI